MYDLSVLYLDCSQKINAAEFYNKKQTHSSLRDQLSRIAILFKMARTEVYHYAECF